MERVSTRFGDAGIPETEEGGHLRTARLLVVGAAVALLVLGWRHFWFLTDDAFIAFRYVRNAVLGYGFVWNRPPFLPVEGYTSFLWVWLLKGVWQLSGLEPPAVANWISLAFSVGTLLLAARMLNRIAERFLPPGWALLVLGLGLLQLVCNPTFLIWASSGLETALFNFLVLAWVWLAVFAAGGPRQIGCLASVAACLYLARPDGVLFVAATLAPFSMREYRKRRMLASLTPLLVVPLHFLWRLETYGAPWPNTYYAKVGAPWPASGLRHLGSFVLEYGLWVWLVSAGIAAIVALRARARDDAAPPRVAGIRARAGVAIAATTIAAQVAYYVLVVGGDHFEYRIFSHLLPLLAVSGLWLSIRICRSPRGVALLMGLALLAELPIPWSYHRRATEAAPGMLHGIKVPIAESWPGAFRWYAAAFDDLQSWLVDHYVGIRHEEHRRNAAYLRRLFERVPADREWATKDPPVLVFPAVGIAGWRLPNVAIIDTHGLNDWVTARTPPGPERRRRIAHEHVAPRDYVACFQPNVRVSSERGVEILPRSDEFGLERIVTCEDRWRTAVASRWFDFGGAIGH